MGLLDALLHRPSPEVTFLRNEVARLEAAVRYLKSRLDD